MGTIPKTRKINEPEPQDPVEIFLKDIKFTGLLKEGYFSCVHLARFISEEFTEETIIVKIFKEKKINEHAFVKDTAYIHTPLRMNNGNLVQMIGYCVDLELKIQAHVLSYEALIIGGRVINDLHAYLIYLRENFKATDINNQDDKIFSSPTDEELHSFATQIASACEFLHGKKIIHGDLATRNILLNQDKKIKLTDFGLKRMKKGIISGNDCNVSFRWSPPPYKNQDNSIEADIWAFGIVLWEIATLGGLPYSNYSNHEVARIIETGEMMDLAPIHNVTLHLQLMMNKCLCEIKHWRPDFQKLAEELRNLNCGECQLYNTLSSFNLDSLPDATIQNDLYNFPSEVPEIKWLITDHVKNLRNDEFVKTSIRNVKPKLREKNNLILGHVCLVGKNLNGKLKADPLFNDEIRDIYKKVVYHPNVVKIIALCKNYETGLLLEYQSIRIFGSIYSSSLKEYLKHLHPRAHNYIAVNTQELGWFSLQIARGMAYLHEKEITHGNLSTKNILINDAKILKITDYFMHFSKIELSYCKDDDRLILPSCRWVSPEFIQTLQPTVGNDIWAFGITLWNIARFDDRPYRHLEDDKVIIYRLKNEKLIPIKPHNVTDDLWEIMKSCWVDDAAQRPEMKNIESELLSLTSKKKIFLNFEPQEEEELESEFIQRSSFPIFIRNKRQSDELFSRALHRFSDRLTNQSSFRTPKRRMPPLIDTEFFSPPSVVFPRHQVQDLTPAFEPPEQYEQSDEIPYQPPPPPEPLHVYQVQASSFPNPSTLYQEPLSYQQSPPAFSYIPSGFQNPTNPHQEPLILYQPAFASPSPPNQRPLAPIQHQSPLFPHPQNPYQHSFPPFPRLTTPYPIPHLNHQHQFPHSQDQLVSFYPSSPFQHSPPNYYPPTPPVVISQNVSYSVNPTIYTTSGENIYPSQIHEYIPHSPEAAPLQEQSVSIQFYLSGSPDVPVTLPFENLRLQNDPDVTVICPQCGSHLYNGSVCYCSPS